MSILIAIVALAVLFVVFGVVTLISGRHPACGECGKRERSGCRTCGANLEKEGVDG